MVAIVEDIKAIYRNDPAARTIEFLIYPCFHALLIHRLVAHPMYWLKIPFFPRLVSQISRFFTSIEIHPGAKIGEGLFIDHGMGVVIGETSEIGKNCVLFHNATLGGTGKQRGKRHPTIGNNVLIGTGATLLGPITVGDNVLIGAETVVINRDIPGNCTVIGAPGRIVKKDGKKVNLPLPLSDYWKKHKELSELQGKVMEENGH